MIPTTERNALLYIALGLALMVWAVTKSEGFFLLMGAACNLRGLNLLSQ